jgi:hypothetical protein
MAATKATHLLVIRGDTRPSKEVLKKAGWTWSPEGGHWYMRLVPAHAERVRANDTSFMYESLKLNRKGCQVTLDGSVVWTSKSFGGAKAEAPIPGDIDNCDAHGNRVASSRIPGSAPDDRI